MNAVEIEVAISALAEQPFDAAEFPFAFLEAFGNKETTLKRLRKGETNKSDLANTFNAVLQTNNIHIATCKPGEVTHTLQALKASPATARAKARFVLATDGDLFEAEDLTTGETIACAYPDLDEEFDFFFALAGIKTSRPAKDHPLDVKATRRLNKLHVELLKHNPDWGTAQRRHDMNHFMARLIFCFFAQSTDIFFGDALFVHTIEQMSARDASDTHTVMATIFRAMNVKPEAKGKSDLPRWAEGFPYVNGGLFSDSPEVPRFSKIARSYLIHIGNLDWKKINPDIFGSMIQAVADDDERGALGMHYTSVPNILKVLNPLFLDDLRAKLEEAGDNARMLLNLRKRMAKIRVFDPACGSGNFLVIAYKEMRAIEAAINERRNEGNLRTEIPLTNFRGIELRDFPAEIARLALIIAEYQCDVTFRGQKEALRDFLPLDAQNWITCGNALRLDWLSICPPTGTGVKLHGDDLFHTPLDQAQIDFENEGGETYICGNPPFSGSRKQTKEQKHDLEIVFSITSVKWKNSDYVAAWFWKAALYNKNMSAPFCFVATNSICQGQQIPIIWRLLLSADLSIRFAHESFKWNNLANNNAGVTVVIICLDCIKGGDRTVYSVGAKRSVDHINPYLTSVEVNIVDARSAPISHLQSLDYGVYYSKSEGLILDRQEKINLETLGFPANLLREFWGTSEFLYGKARYCLWLDDQDVEQALRYDVVKTRIETVRHERLATSDKAVNKLAERPYMFRERKADGFDKIFVPIVCSENRYWFPAGIAGSGVIPSSRAFFMQSTLLYELAIILTRIHLVWISTICGRFELRFVYSNTLGWNTFPVPTLTEKNKADLTRCAEDILLAREAHFPATIADLYDPEAMPANLREAHERNDETLERIYIGRRFKNDTERLEKLFELYTKMTASAAAKPVRRAKA